MSDVATLPAAPAGAHWEFNEVSTNHGKDPLGEQPILVWDNVEGAKAHYGEEGVINSLNGTSLLVSYQGIARRIAIANAAKEGNTVEKTQADVAEAVLKFVPGKRQEPTPAGAAARSAKALAEQVGEKGAGAIAKLLNQIREKMASGELTAEELEALELS